MTAIGSRSKIRVHWEHRESFPLSQIWSKSESEHRWKGSIVAKGAEHAYPSPESGLPSTRCRKSNFVHPPSYVTRSFQPEVRSMWLLDQRALTQKENEKKSETHQSKPLNSFEVSIHVKNKSTDKQNDIISHG